MYPQELSQLPPDIQQQIAALLRQRNTSANLAQSGMAPTPNEVINGRVIPQGGGQILAKVLSSYFGNKGMEKADEGIVGIRQQDAERYSAEAGALTGSQSRGAIVRALASKDPRIAALAASLQKRNDERMGKYADLKKGVDAPGAANDFFNDQMTPTGSFPQPEFKQLPGAAPNAAPTLVNYGEGGRPNATQPANTTITNTLTSTSGDDYKASLEQQQKELEVKREQAGVARKVLNTASAAMQALQEGAQAGGLENYAQAVKDVAQAFGIKFDDKTPTANLQMALGQAILEAAQMVKPISNFDLPFLEKQIGSIATDPQALVRSLAIMTAGSVQGLSNYNEYLNSVREHFSKTPNKALGERALSGLAGQEIGYEVPKALPGNQLFQMEVARQLRNQGFDINKIEGLDPQFVKDIASGKRVDIDIRSNIPGIKSLPGPTKAGAPLTIDQLSPDQLKALEAVLRARQQPTGQ